MTFYKTPPKYAKNFIDCLVLRIDLGYLNKLSDLEFMQYFFSKLDKFGFKGFNITSNSTH